MRKQTKKQNNLDLGLFHGMSAEDMRHIEIRDVIGESVVDICYCRDVLQLGSGEPFGAYGVSVRSVSDVIDSRRKGFVVAKHRLGRAIDYARNLGLANHDPTPSEMTVVPFGPYGGDVSDGEALGMIPLTRYLSGLGLGKIGVMPHSTMGNIIAEASCRIPFQCIPGKKTRMICAPKDKRMFETWDEGAGQQGTIVHILPLIRDEIISKWGFLVNARLGVNKDLSQKIAFVVDAASRIENILQANVQRAIFPPTARYTPSSVIRSIEESNIATQTKKKAVSPPSGKDSDGAITFPALMGAIEKLANEIEVMERIGKEVVKVERKTIKKGGGNGSK